MAVRNHAGSLVYLILGLVLTTLFAFQGPRPLVAGEASGKTKQDAKKKGSGNAFEFSRSDPIYITSDWMEVDQKSNTIKYRGRVVTVQGEMTMRSETLTAYYDPEMKQMKQIIAEGKVHTTQGDRVATGAKLVFDDQTKTMTLTGSPMVRQGNSQVTGTKIVFFTEEDRAVAEGGPQQRVRATIFPDELQKQEKGEGGPGKEK